MSIIISFYKLFLRLSQESLAFSKRIWYYSGRYEKAMTGPSCTDRTASANAGW